MRTYAIYRNGRASSLRLTPEPTSAWPGRPLLASEQQIRMEVPEMATVVHMDGEEIELGLNGE